MLTESRLMSSIGMSERFLRSWET